MSHYFVYDLKFDQCVHFNDKITHSTNKFSSNKYRSTLLIHLLQKQQIPHTKQLQKHIGRQKDENKPL